MTDPSFDWAYRDGLPPWEIGRPQPEFVRLAEEGAIRGTVLDVGCGTGEQALDLAARGHDVLGVDASPTAIERAREKAAERGSEAEFVVWDALDLERLGRAFETVIDSGLFHVFADEERPRFVAGLRRVVASGGRYLMVCFSEHEPGTWGPRRVTQAEIRDAFGDGWRIDEIRKAMFETNLGPVRAWLASIARDG